METTRTVQAAPTPTPLGRWALAVQLLEAAARRINVPTTEAELREYERTHPLVEGVSLYEAERNYAEQMSELARRR